MTKKEKKEFSQRMAAARRKGGAGGRRRSGRRANPILGVPVKPMVKSGLGFAAGAFIGTQISSLLGMHVLSRLTNNILQAIGFTLGGIGELILGEWASKKLHSLPMTEIAGGASVAMFTQAFNSLGLVPLGSVAPAAELPPGGPAAGYFPRRRRPRRMSGGFINQSLPGGMAGTLQPMPRAMSGFGGLLS
jgi:hypothetical protein